MDEWRQESLIFKLDGYRDGWIGLFDHLFTLITNRPAKLVSKDYTFSIFVKGDNVELSNSQSEEDNNV